MFFRRMTKIEPEGVTPKRIQAAKAKLTKRRNDAKRRNESVGLFPEMHEPIPEGDPIKEIHEHDCRLVDHVWKQRLIEAEKWRQGRKELRALSPKDKARVLEHWNRGIYPGDAGWFISTMRAILRGSIRPEDIGIGIDSARIRGQCAYISLRIANTCKAVLREAEERKKQMQCHKK